MVIFPALVSLRVAINGTSLLVISAADQTRRSLSVVELILKGEFGADARAIVTAAQLAPPLATVIWFTSPVSSEAAGVPLTVVFSDLSEEGHSTISILKFAVAVPALTASRRTCP